MEGSYKQTFIATIDVFELVLLRKDFREKANTVLELQILRSRVIDGTINGMELKVIVGKVYTTIIDAMIEEHLQFIGDEASAWDHFSKYVHMSDEVSHRILHYT